MIKRIHVNQAIIRSNRKTGAADPPISIKTYKENIVAHSVHIDGPCRLIYRPRKPLACGARLWIETTSTVVADGKTYA